MPSYEKPADISIQRRDEVLQLLKEIKKEVQQPAEMISTLFSHFATQNLINSVKIPREKIDQAKELIPEAKLLHKEFSMADSTDNQLISEVEGYISVFSQYERLILLKEYTDDITKLFGPKSDLKEDRIDQIESELWQERDASFFVMLFPMLEDRIRATIPTTISSYNKDKLFKENILDFLNNINNGLNKISAKILPTIPKDFDDPSLNSLSSFIDEQKNLTAKKILAVEAIKSWMHFKSEKSSMIIPMFHNDAAKLIFAEKALHSLFTAKDTTEIKSALTQLQKECKSASLNELLGDEKGGLLVELDKAPQKASSHQSESL